MDILQGNSYGFSFLNISISMTPQLICSSSWEIPALRSRKVTAVSDSDGISYPWYGNTTEIATVVGPTDTYTSMHLTVSLHFYILGNIGLWLLAIVVAY